MKPSLLATSVLAAVLLPATAFAADARPRKNAPAPENAGTKEALKLFDKNNNQLIDPEELAALQQSFSALRKLDVNSNGEIEQAEVDRPKDAPSMPKRRGRGLAGLQQVDKNGNRKIDAHEVEALEKLLAGGRMMSRLDQNGNGKLEPAEVERLNERISKGFGRGRKGAGTPPPAKKAPEKPAETPAPAEAPKTEEKNESAIPAAPAPEAKAPGSFGT